MRIAQDSQHRYYDADRFPDGDKAWDEGKVRWYTCLLGDKDIPNESEEDVLARSPHEAREVMRAAIERDFVSGTLVTKVLLA